MLCAPLWTANTGDAILSSPAVVGGVVYVGSDDGKLYAFERRRHDRLLGHTEDVHAAVDRSDGRADQVVTGRRR